MKGILKEIIFTDKKLDGDYLKNKFGKKFYMLHLKVKFEDGEKILSQYYTVDKEKEIKDKIQKGKEYEFIFTQSGIYFNLKNIILDNNIIH